MAKNIHMIRSHHYIYIPAFTRSYGPHIYVCHLRSYNNPITYDLIDRHPTHNPIYRSYSRAKLLPGNSIIQEAATHFYIRYVGQVDHRHVLSPPRMDHRHVPSSVLRSGSPPCALTPLEWITAMCSHSYQGGSPPCALTHRNGSPPCALIPIWMDHRHVLSSSIWREDHHVSAHPHTGVDPTIKYALRVFHLNQPNNKDLSQRVTIIKQGHISQFNTL